MKISLKSWIFLFVLGCGSCAPLPFNGIVTVTPTPALVQVSPTPLSTATSQPATVTTLVEESTATVQVPQATGTSAAAIQPTGTQMPPVSSTPLPAVLQDMVEKARAELSTRLSIPETDITLIQASAVSWADLSLGCPQPGMMYGQMVTSGYLIILHAGSTQYYYHAGPGKDPFYCSSPQPPIQVNPGESQ